MARAYIEKQKFKPPVKCKFKLSATSKEKNTKNWMNYIIAKNT